MKLYDVATGKTKTIFSPWRESYHVRLVPGLDHGGGAAGRRTGDADALRGERGNRQGDPDRDRLLQRGQLLPGQHGSRLRPRASEEFGGKINIVRDPVTGGPTSTLTHDGISGWPLWGPQGQIVFVKQLNAKGRKYGPKNDLFLMNANGKGVKRLTHTKVDPLTAGLFPTAWSASGNQLLTEFGGQDTSYAVAVESEDRRRKRT